MKRRTLVHTIGASITLGTIGIAAAEDEEAYAEIAFSDQKSDGTSVIVDRLEIEANGFITIHTWDLIAEQDGPNTIAGVSDLLTPGVHHDAAVNLFEDGTGYSDSFDQDRLELGTHRLLAVPHRDVSGTGEFEFAGDSHTDIPFTNGPQTRSDLPVDGAVNDVADVVVSRGRGEPKGFRGRSSASGGKRA